MLMVCWCSWNCSGYCLLVFQTLYWWDFVIMGWFELHVTVYRWKYLDFVVYFYHFLSIFFMGERILLNSNLHDSDLHVLIIQFISLILAQHMIHFVVVQIIRKRHCLSRNGLSRILTRITTVTFSTLTERSDCSFFLVCLLSILSRNQLYTIHLSCIYISQIIAKVVCIPYQIIYSKF